MIPKSRSVQYRMILFVVTPLSSPSHTTSDMLKFYECLIPEESDASCSLQATASCGVNLPFGIVVRAIVSPSSSLAKPKPHCYPLLPPGPAAPCDWFVRLHLRLSSTRLASAAMTAGDAGRMFRRKPTNRLRGWIITVCRYHQ